MNITEKHPLFSLVEEVENYKSSEIAEKDKVIESLKAELEKEKSTNKAPKDRRIQRIIDAALFCMSEKIPYVFGGKMIHSTESKRGSYDCSAFVQALYKSVGTTLPRVSRDQAKMGRRVDLDKLRPADILFYDTTGKKERINHVAIYIGDGQMIHTNSPKDGIHIQDVKTGRHAKWILEARRVLPEEALEGYGY